MSGEDQDERRREVELKRLGGDITLAIFRDRRKETQIVEPNAPLDEVSYRDYKARRDAGES